MQLEEVDIVGAEAAKAAFHGLHQVEARGTDIVRPGAASKGRFRRNEHLIAATFDGCAEDFLGRSFGVDIRRIEKIQTGLEANVDESRGFLGADGAPRLEEFIGSAEGASAKTKSRDL